MGNANSIYDDHPEGVLKYKKNGNISYCNGKILEILKYPEGKSPKSIFDLIPEDYKGVHSKYLKSKGIMKPNMDIMIICYDKTIKKIRVTHLRPDTIIFKNKITDDYKTIIEQTEDLCSTGYCKINLSNGDTTLSDGINKIFELDYKEKKDYNSCVFKEDSKILSQALENHKNYKIRHRIVTKKTKNIKWIDRIGSFNEAYDQDCLYEVIRDVTEEVKLEESLKLKSIEAEKNLKTKTEFVASVSHELRTPLNGIIGMISLLGLTELTEKQDKYVSVLSNSSGVLLSIINNILDFSKIEAGKAMLDYSLFNIKTSMTRIVDLFRPMCITKNIELFLNFEISGEEDIISDKLKISQILSNLLSNSIKFTSEGSVSLLIKVSGNVLTIVVSDTGIGMQQEFIDRITEPFTQADSSTTRVYGGSGLGISIVNSYIKLLKGTLEFKSKEGVGTSIIMNIPISRENLNKVIVVVEDNMANRYIVKEMISESVKIPIVCYENGKHLLDNIKEEPLLIFMDLHMPIMDGHSATKILRERGFMCPIVALTANSVKSERIKCLISGMDDFMLKPIDLSDMRNILQKYKIS
jgi:signal transduction histidine kinase